MTDPIIVSYSELAKWDTCHRQHFYSFGMNLQPTEYSDPINTGIQGHTLLQSFYTALSEGHSKQEALDLTEKKAKHILEGASITLMGSLVKAWTLVYKYVTENDFKAKSYVVENRFLIPISKITDVDGLDDVLIGFTPDVVFERNGGFFDVEDSKFVSKAWSKDKLERFTQAKLYEILLKRMGYNVSRSAVRFFNVATGQITSKSDQLKAVEEQTLINDFVGAVSEVVEMRRKPMEERKKARRTTSYNLCQGCSFVFPCNLEAEGKDATKTFNSLYKKSNYDYSK